MSITIDAQRNKLMHLENSLMMYGVYYVETLSKLFKTAQVLHSQQILVEQLFAGQQDNHMKFTPKCKMLMESNIM